MMGKFGYGHYTGIDLAEERSATCLPANGNRNALKNRGIRVHHSGWYRSGLLDSDPNPDE